MLKDPTNDVGLPGKTSFFDKAIRRPSFAQHISRGSGNWGKNRDRRGACRMFVRTASQREARVSCSGWENGRKGERGQFSLPFLALLPLCMQSVCRAIPGDSSVILYTCVVQYSVYLDKCRDNHCRPRCLSLSRVWMTKMRECTGGRRADFSAFSCEHVLNPPAGKWKLCSFPV